ncbi:hypothetical protein TNCV_4865391 [Trichonephila clavipes]|nr:hypothetical protein TNCV_4865391 [Trichonephila clavipes]
MGTDRVTFKGSVSRMRPVGCRLSIAGLHHEPYSPGPAPSDFSALKNNLTGRRFESNADVKKPAYSICKTLNFSWGLFEAYQARPGLKKKFDFDQSLDSEKSCPWRRRAAIFRKLRSACVEVGTIDKYSACVEVGTNSV